MINFRTIYKVLGSLLFLEASLMTLCAGISFYYAEDDMPAFLFSVLITILGAFAMKLLGKDAGNILSRRDSFLLVTLVWLLFSLFGALPFMISGYVSSFTDAYFETISGFTTTGATVINDVEQLPHAILFWRSLTQWIGGLGIVFLTIALLPSMTGGSVKVFAAEATGPVKAKLHPRLSTTAKWLWTIYLLLTLACVGSYMLCGMHFFESINYAMTTTATGGFAIHNDGLQHFNTPWVEYACTLFCFLSGVNFTLLYYSASKMRPMALFKNDEFKFYSILTLACSAVVVISLFVTGLYSFEHAFRSGLFQVVSFLTSTGLFNEDVAGWPPVAVILLAICMVVGASSGSTASGMKSVRVLMLLKIVSNEFRQILHPNAVLPLKVNGVNVTQQKRVTLLAFVTMFAIISLLMFTAMMAFGLGTVNAAKISLSCLCNVGPSLDTGVGPNTTWSALPDMAKWMCAMTMLVGRLEIFSVLVMFTRSFWKEN